MGRGTDAPFEQLGAPVDSLRRLAEFPELEANSRRAFHRRQLYSPRWSLQRRGLRRRQTRNHGRAPRFDSIRIGLEIADALHRLYPERFQVTKLMGLLASQATVDALIQYQSPATIIASWADELAQFRTLRAKYLLYN